jgi:hypothetical protein
MMSYGNHINYNTGQPCDCSLAINGGHYYRDGVAFVSMSPADILAAIRTLPGVEEIVVDVKYDVEPFMKKGPFFVDYDYEVASDLEPGRYLVVPLSEEE